MGLLLRLTQAASCPTSLRQEITFDYQPRVVHRPDMSLYIYGERCRRARVHGGVAGFTRDLASGPAA